MIDESTPTFVGVINSASVMEEYMKLQCKKPLPDAFPAADPPALPLHLESGGLELDVLTALGTIQVDTTNARSRLVAGPPSGPAMTPPRGVSGFACLAGTLQVQPTATGAPLLTLVSGQFVDVTASGGRPYRPVSLLYLPLLQR